MNTPSGWQHWRMDAAALAIIAGLGVIAYLGQISPTLARHEQAQAQATRLVTEEANSRELERRLHTLSGQLEAKTRDLAHVRVNLEPATELNQRLARLTDVVGENGVQVDAIESGATVNFDRYSTIAIRLTGRATYRNCTTLIRQLRSTMPDTGIVSLRLTSGGVDSNNPATLVLEMLWYSQPQAKPAKK